MRKILLLALAVLLLATPLAATTVTTPRGSFTVTSRGDLLDLVELIRLTGAQVAFAPAAGSYGAVLDGHDVQFTPGGSLAVVDGRLQPLPGPIRQIEGRAMASLATASALLAPLGWSLRPTAGGFELTQSATGDRLELSLLQDQAGPMVVIAGSSLRPQVTSMAGVVSVLYPVAVRLAHAVPEEDVLAGGEIVDGRTLRLRLRPGTELSSSYFLDAPPRLVLRLASVTERGGMAGEPARPSGPVVVLDPGHGGEDHGARGPGGELEKDLTLAVARMVAARLQAAGIAARLTRDADDTISLADRTALANRLEADAFVSIHANASTARGARGAETYFMNVEATDASAAASAARENASAAGDTVQLILWDLAHVANLNASSRLARGVQERLNAMQGITDRGVKQAPFVVLTGATMPAALVEIGFLSNRAEAARLLSRGGQDEVAAALADAITAFLSTPEPSPAAAP